jgi:hypothetical protein
MATAGQSRPDLASASIEQPFASLSYFPYSSAARVMQRYCAPVVTRFPK